MPLNVIAAIVLSLVWSASSHAQTPTSQIAQAEAAPKPAEAPQGAAGKTKMFGDWAMICGAVPGSSDEICEVDVTLKPENEAPPVAKVAFVRSSKDGPARLVAIIAANLTLQSGVEIARDAGKPGVTLTFKSCLNEACLADATLTTDQLQSFRSKSLAPGRLTIKDASGQPLSLPLPFRGLDEALEALYAPQDK
jgi:invasion protein IalB